MTRKRFHLRKGQPQYCRLCRSALEPAGTDWICASCLVRWHGDTFEPLEKDSPDLPPWLDFGFET